MRTVLVSEDGSDRRRVRGHVVLIVMVCLTAIRAVGRADQRHVRTDGEFACDRSPAVGEADRNDCGG